MPLTCADCFRAHKQAWLAAFDHEFLRESKKGTISKKQFDTWLAQDYHFAKEFTRLAAALLTSAPYHDFDLLLGGLEAMRSELTWFQEQAKERNLALDVSPQEANTSFCKFMQHVASQPYAVQAVAFWSIEQAYNEAWKRASPVAEAYQKFADRWGSDDFSKYCGLLQQSADNALKEASQEVQEQAIAVCAEVAAHEQAFWQMAYAA